MRCWQEISARDTKSRSEPTGSLRKYCLSQAEGWELATQRIISEFTLALHQLDGFGGQNAELVESAPRDCSSRSPERLRKLVSDEAWLARDRDTLMSVVCVDGNRPMFQEELDAFDELEKKLKRERYALEESKSQELVLPSSSSVTDLS